MALPDISGFISPNRPDYGQMGQAGMAEEAKNEILDFGLTSQIKGAGVRAAAGAAIGELQAEQMRAAGDAEQHSATMGSIGRFAGDAVGAIGGIIGGGPAASGMGSALSKLNSGIPAVKPFGSMPHSFGGFSGGVG